MLVAARMDWHCDACGFVNIAALRICDACDAPSRPPPVTADGATTVPSRALVADGERLPLLPLAHPPPRRNSEARAEPWCRAAPRPQHEHADVYTVAPPTDAHAAALPMVLPLGIPTLPPPAPPMTPLVSVLAISSASEATGVQDAVSAAKPVAAPAAAPVVALEAAPDAARDAAPDVARDAVRDAMRDTTCDTAPDAAPDAAPGAMPVLALATIAADALAETLIVAPAPALAAAPAAAPAAVSAAASAAVSASARPAESSAGASPALPAAPEGYGSRDFAWSDEAAQANRIVFGGELRPLQRRAVDAAMDGRDLLVVLPTGAGKSRCTPVRAEPMPFPLWRLPHRAC